jgi:2-methylisocitrate lyase-like PEP mutase family enzyme
LNKRAQTAKSRDFLALHHDPKLLVLPNIWDPLGARLLQSLGFPAVATASAAIAFSLGYNDGQRIRFAEMLRVIRAIASSVDVPVTADVESGYAVDPSAVADNVRQVIGAGAVGINLEDTEREGGPLFAIELQCDRIRAVRAMADREGVPLVINARTDVFLGERPGSRSDKIAETILRARAYLDAGANCIYPITVGDIETLRLIYEETAAPLNVYATKSTAPMTELEAAGISRLSLGPGLLKASLTTMKKVALALRDYGSYDLFTKGVISTDEVEQYVSHDRMPE